LILARNESRNGTLQRMFLSGYDIQEDPPSYFLCQLPTQGARDWPDNVDSAYERLKPQTVKLALKAGRVVKRQGDLFLIEMPTVTTKALLDDGYDLCAPWQVAGTNHRAEEAMVKVSPDRTITFVRGCLVHVPEGRPPDHSPLCLGETWFLAIRNTVPSDPPDSPVYPWQR
ncbi:MAG: hypothetical protein ABSE77_16915, partial [Acidimicrobiales bacterium]